MHMNLNFEVHLFCNRRTTHLLICFFGFQNSLFLKFTNDINEKQRVIDNSLSVKKDINYHHYD